ncbi:MAG: TraC family protein [Candidatus Falkowbacteria bacterium]
MPKPPKRSNIPSTQNYLTIGEIRENTIVMDDNTVTSVLLVSSINFALKNEDEQNAIIGGYVNFLNNISYPLQIVVQSRELNIDGYLNDLRERERQQTNELLRQQTAEYVDFVTQLIALGKIMSKRFYVVVSYNPLSDEKKTFLARVGDLFNPVKAITMKEQRFKDLRKELDRRVDTVISGLESMGLSVAELDTQSLIELYYNIYNPEESKNEQLASIKEMRVQ